MSTTNSTSYRLHLAEQPIVEVELDCDQPVYRLIDDLVARFHLTPVPEGYGLFGGAERRPISREQTLARTSYAGGGDLYLAPARAPWWLAQAAGAGVAAALPPRPPLARRLSLSLKSALPVVLGLAAFALLGLMLFWPDEAPSTGAAPGTGGFQAPGQPTTLPTATLLATTPTPDPDTQAALNYQSGLKAYEAQDWATAAAALQAVFNYKADYLDLRNLLAATYYNWGIAARDGSDIAAARERFAAALQVNPAHELAPGELKKAQLYLDAGQAASGNAQAAIDDYRALLAAHGGNYADVAQQLYALLIARGSALVEVGGEEHLRTALSLYQEAAGLPVADRSAAEQGSAAVTQLLPPPTPTPVPGKLRFRVLNYDDSPDCISVKITGINTKGWRFSVDGMKLAGSFSSSGNARLCGLGPGQEVTLTVFNAKGQVAPGGAGVPSRGSAIMVASWR